MENNEMMAFHMSLKSPENTFFVCQIFRRHLAKTWGNKKGRCYWMDEAVVKKYV